VVRTPAFLIENLPGWQRLAARLVEDVPQEIKEKLRQAKASGETISPTPMPNAEYLPLRVTKEPSADGKSVLIKTETVVGRGTWIFAMRHLLTNTLNRLMEHRWTIVSSEDDLPWFTTDDPVVRLNFRSPSDYDFKGGWAKPNTNIFLPLSPRHLLFTQVGQKTYQRGEILPRQMAVMLRKMIAEHAFRYVFSPQIDPAVAQYRPRTIDAGAINQEREQWRKWHEEQSSAERELAR
jgi:hypothetical protein